jgi:hypothetical protein
MPRWPRLCCSVGWHPRQGSENLEDDVCWSVQRCNQLAKSVSRFTAGRYKTSLASWAVSRTVRTITCKECAYLTVQSSAFSPFFHGTCIIRTKHFVSEGSAEFAEGKVGLVTKHETPALAECRKKASERAAKHVQDSKENHPPGPTVLRSALHPIHQPAWSFGLLQDSGHNSNIYHH